MTNLQVILPVRDDVKWYKSLRKQVHETSTDKRFLLMESLTPSGLMYFFHIRYICRCFSQFQNNFITCNSYLMFYIYWLIHVIQKMKPYSLIPLYSYINMKFHFLVKMYGGIMRFPWSYIHIFNSDVMRRIYREHNLYVETVSRSS